jgi:hypothetical protein
MLSPAIRKSKIIESWFTAAGLKTPNIVRYPPPHQSLLRCGRAMRCGRSDRNQEV